MEDLIAQLKKEHEYVLEKFTKVNELGLGTDGGYAEAWGAKDALFSHLQKEDKLLYPYLRRAAEENDELRSMLVIFSDEMEAVAILADKFYSRYTVKTDLPSITDKFKVVYEQIKLRVKHEEEFIFKEFSKLNNGL